MIQSKELFDIARKHIPGGVNSPVRAFHGVGKDPIFIKSAHGAYVTDADGRDYIDYVGSWGPMIAGHANPVVMKKVEAAIKNGFSFGAPTEIEVLLAQKVCQMVPSMEMVRFVNSGTEATMSAIRLARGATKRDKIIKFAGCYHGHADSLLVSAGSGALTLGVPSSAGVPESIAKHTLVAEYNHIEEVKALFTKYENEIAAVIVEPVAGNMNCVLPDPGFLEGLRALCTENKSLLIFDEVMTGFRVAKGGAQERFGVRPDITTLGKVIGGGFPVGAFGGSKKVMQHVAPLGQVYQAGTLSGNPIAMTAGLATLELIDQPGFYEQLTEQTKKLVDGLKRAAESAGVPLYVNAVGGMFGFFFTDRQRIRSLGNVSRCNIELFKRFFHGMLDRGVYLAPSAYEAGFVSSAHTDIEINKTLRAAEEIFIGLRKGKHSCTSALQAEQA